MIPALQGLLESVCVAEIHREISVRNTDEPFHNPKDF